MVKRGLNTSLFIVCAFLFNVSHKYHKLKHVVGVFVGAAVYTSVLLLSCPACKMVTGLDESLLRVGLQVA